MRRFITAFLILVAGVAAAQVSPRRHAIGWPFALTPCAPGTVTRAPGVRDFAVAGGFLYFGDDSGAVSRLPIEGGTVTTLTRVAGTQVRWVAADDARVYFATAAADALTADIASVPKDGGAPVTIASAVMMPTQFASDAQFIYWVFGGTLAGEDILSDGAVRRVAKAGGAVQTLAGGLSFPLSIAVAGGNVYFSESGIAAGNNSAGLRRMAAAGGAVEHLFDGFPVRSIAVDDANAYFVVSRVGTGLVDIERVPAAGGSATPMVTGLDSADGLALAGGSLYFTAATAELPSIEAINIASGAQRTVKDVDTAIARLAFDNCMIYFATAAESIVRALR